MPATFGLSRRVAIARHTFGSRTLEVGDGEVGDGDDVEGEGVGAGLEGATIGVGAAAIPALPFAHATRVRRATPIDEAAVRLTGDLGGSSCSGSRRAAGSRCPAASGPSRRGRRADLPR